ncbi:MAG: glycosyltransferase family 4 protein [Flavobacteriales bacterium]|nr:glycosyltransferase family 4 protein [Flavobacteriales bacterium]
MDTIEINVFAKSGDQPWLFDDLKIHFGNLHLPGIRIVTSETCIDTADAWIAIRTAEAAYTPDPSRTVACIHDLYDHDGMYDPGGLRSIIHSVKGLVLCHPDQQNILQKAAVDFSKKEIVQRPIGALSDFRPGDIFSDKFTIGWVGRNYWRKRIEWFIEAIEGLEIPKDQFRIMLMGMDIEEPADKLRSMGYECSGYPKNQYPIATYPDLYRKMSCLVVTGVTEAGPLTLFESLATGNPVIATKVGWAPLLSSAHKEAIVLVENPQEISTALHEVYDRRNDLFQQRFVISDIVNHWTLEKWVREVILLAASLAPQKTMENIELIDL